MDSPGASAIHLSSGYLDDTYQLNGTKFLSLTGTPGGNGKLSFYLGACVLGPFGDTFRCTDWGAVTWSILMPRIDMEDPHREGRTLFDIQMLESSNPNFILTETLRLVLPSERTKGSYLLLLLANNNVRKVIVCNPGQSSVKPQ